MVAMMVVVVVVVAVHCSDAVGSLVAVVGAAPSPLPLLKNDEEEERVSVLVVIQGTIFVFHGADDEIVSVTVLRVVSMQADDEAGSGNGPVSVAGVDVVPIGLVGPAPPAVELVKGKGAELGSPVPELSGQVRVPDAPLPVGAEMLDEFDMGNGALHVGALGTLPVTRGPEPVAPAEVEFGHGNGAADVIAAPGVPVRIPVPEDTAAELEFFQGKGGRAVLELVVVIENAGAVPEPELHVGPAAVGPTAVVELLMGKGGVCTVVWGFPDDPCTLVPKAAVPVGPARLVELLSGNGAVEMLLRRGPPVTVGPGKERLPDGPVSQGGDGAVRDVSQVEYSLVKAGESSRLEYVACWPEAVLPELKSDADVLQRVREGDGSE
ncbi:hypothetical protein MYCTH_2107631 [Thermothelomyces thermophilus ATCC 42464]|uniref:Secreted protein n=1 Tax=Thermothelomyces thermophilus (strain ATCC 42464 / BCRC 31852 / DSM 1799) TaxID=573729 RepID=G2Q146_THET4|nr:uncharacterized protein MYCTH_2107631 [Thermothelomyces thermophilus ATCC 42464]AEO54945.1 hypothetical protein MYCTH_2107631 [Thermothelomyces thermophilus ATCC 42464]